MMSVYVIAIFCAVCLAGSVANVLYTQYLLKRCHDILDFCINLAERECEPIKREGTE